jgi:hypothetical protein
MLFKNFNKNRIENSQGKPLRKSFVMKSIMENKCQFKSRMNLGEKLEIVLNFKKLDLFQICNGCRSGGKSYESQNHQNFELREKTFLDVYYFEDVSIVVEYTDASYQDEIHKIEKGFSPLVEKCKRLKRAMRIGTNHGSLSDRIMNRFGDTPFGMVESALEFARVCRQHDYHDFIFSMKASNPLVMMQAYRLLVAEMMKIGWDYPLHLGVTEAGEGEDGRVKSAVALALFY